MAKNSLREQILVYHKKYILEKISSISYVIRTMPDYSALQQFAVTQFPLVAMVGRLPVPREKMSSRDRSVVDIIISELSIDNFVYLQTREDQDTVISNVVDDFWAKCYSVPDYGGLALGTTLDVSEEVVQYDPFVAFKLTSRITYKHTTGGI
jgi:hypothetical protein